MQDGTTAAGKHQTNPTKGTNSCCLFVTPRKGALLEKLRVDRQVRILKATLQNPNFRYHVKNIPLMAVTSTFVGLNLLIDWNGIYENGGVIPYLVLRLSRVLFD